MTTNAKEPLGGGSLASLQQLYLDHFGVSLSEAQAEQLAARLLSLFRIIGKPIPISVDTNP